MATILLGTTSTGVDAANSNGGQTALSVRRQALFSGSITAFYLKSPDVVTNKHGAIYSDKAGPLPDARLTANITPPTIVSGWHKYDISGAPLAVVAGNWYWLGFLSSGAGVVYNYTDFAAHPDGGNTEDSTTSQTTMPATYPAFAAFTNIFNAYAEGTLSASADIEARADFEPVRFGPF